MSQDMANILYILDNMSQDMIYIIYILDNMSQDMAYIFGNNTARFGKTVYSPNVTESIITGVDGKKLFLINKLIRFTKINHIKRLNQFITIH